MLRPHVSLANCHKVHCAQLSAKRRSKNSTSMGHVLIGRINRRTQLHVQTSRSLRSFTHTIYLARREVRCFRRRRRALSARLDLLQLSVSSNSSSNLEWNFSSNHDRYCERRSRSCRGFDVSEKVGDPVFPSCCPWLAAWSCTLRGWSSPRKLGPEPWRSAVWLRSGTAVQPREDNPPWRFSRLVRSQHRRGNGGGTLGGTMRGGGPRVTREIPLLWLLWVSELPPAMHFRGGTLARGTSVRLCFSSMFASHSFCNITTTSSNELVTVMQISPTGLVSSPAGMPGRSNRYRGWDSWRVRRERKEHDRHVSSGVILRIDR